MRTSTKAGWYAHCSACNIDYFISRWWLRAAIEFWRLRIGPERAFRDCGKDRDVVTLVRLEAEA